MPLLCENAEDRFYTTQSYVNFIEPTCAYCTVGSYALLSVCLSVCLSTFHWIKIHISETIKARGPKLYHNIKLMYASLGKILITLSKIYF